LLGTNLRKDTRRFIMNIDQSAGRWDQLKGRVKKSWGELTDDDLLRAEGSLDKLVGVIRERVGDSDEAIRARLKAMQAVHQPRHRPEHLVGHLGGGGEGVAGVGRQRDTGDQNTTPNWRPPGVLARRSRAVRLVMW
jgi:uncharacterized protein YjbJ (UPF0337 family)